MLMLLTVALSNRAEVTVNASDPTTCSRTGLVAFSNNRSEGLYHAANGPTGQLFIYLRTQADSLLCAQLKTFADPASLSKSGGPIRLMATDKVKPNGEVAPSKSNATGS
jgi:hypothetical protein